MQAIMFRLQADEYALEVSAVSEAVRMVALAALPDAPDWLAGVVNMRGHIMPVIDLRRRLHLPAPAPDLNTPIIIVHAGERQFGAIVDALEAVIDLPDSVVEPIAGPQAGHSALLGFAHLDDRVVKILDPHSLAASIPVIG
mgnify:CR=1 FL=1